MENKNLIELEAILSFIGIEFIDYKGKRTSNGHRTAKKVGEIRKFFGKDVQTTGMFIEDIERSTMFDIKNDWNWIMFIVDLIKGQSGDEYHLLDAIDDALICVEKEKAYEAILAYIEWHNKNHGDEHTKQ